VWDSISEKEFAMKVDFSPYSPLPLFLDIFHYYVTHVEYFKESISKNTNCNHTKKLLNVSFSTEDG